MIQEDNSGHTHKLDLMHHEVDSLHSENCKMGLEAGSIYKTKTRNKEVSREPRADLVFGNLLTGFLVKQSIYRHINVIRVSLCRRGSILDLEMHFITTRGGMMWS